MDLPPLLALISDFGLGDSYVAEMKAVLLRECPALRVVDVTHLIPRHDILFGAIILERAMRAFEPGTIHLAVVDPGVGTARRLLIAEIHRQLVVCPDNGLITWAWRRLGGGAAHELTWRPDRASTTFHGRDIMAPAAGKLAAGQPIESLARPLADPVLFDLHPARAPIHSGTIIHIDSFGNATTNIPADQLDPPPRSVRIINHDLGALKNTYGDVSPGEPLALIGSSGLLEIAVREGSAAQQLKLKVGDEVRIS